MTTVHFVPCHSDEDPQRIGCLAVAIHDLAALSARPDLGTGPSILQLDTPFRSQPRAMFEAWTAPLRQRLQERGAEEETFGVRTGSASLTLATTGTLHARSGWEGALHFLGVGCVPDEKVEAIRVGLQPHVERDVCGGCGMCVTLCGNDGIRHNGHVAVVKPEACLACGDCLAECYLGALKFPAGGSKALIERIAISAAGVVGASTGLLAIVFLLQGPRRRLASDAHHVPQADLGILAGIDPVAVDQAAADLIAEASGRTLQELSGCPENPLELMDQAQRFGAGSRRYDLLRHDPGRLGC